MVYDAERERMIRALAAVLLCQGGEAMDLAPEHTSRALNREFEDKLAVTVMRRCTLQAVSAGARHHRRWL